MKLHFSTPSIRPWCGFVLLSLTLCCVSCGLFASKQQPAPSASRTKPLQQSSLPDFPQHNATAPLQDGNATQAMQATACAHLTDYPGKELQDMQDILHQQGLDAMLIQALDDPWLQNNLFVESDELPESVRQQAYGCIRVIEESYVNGERLGDLCVSMQGTLVGRGTDDTCSALTRMQAQRTVCLRQEGAPMADLKQQALRMGLRDILAPHDPLLQKADIDELQRVLSSWKVTKERYDKPSSTYCMQLVVRYTPMAATIYAAKNRQQADEERQAAADTPDYHTRTFFLDLNAYAVGTPLPVYGDAVAVVQDQQGVKTLGLNGLTQGQAAIGDLVCHDPPPPTAGQAKPAGQSAQAAAQPDDAPQTPPQQVVAPPDANTDARSAPMGKDLTPQQPSDAAGGSPQDAAAASSPETRAQTPDDPPSAAKPEAPDAAPQKSDAATASVQQPQGAQAAPPIAPKPLLHKAATEKGTPPRPIPLAPENIVDFTLTMRVNHDLRPPSSGVSGFMPVMELIYQDWIRDDLAVQLRLGDDRKYQAQFRFLGVETNYLPFPKPSAPHSYRFERSNGLARLYLDDQPVATAPSSGRALQRIILPLYNDTRLYTLNVEQRITKQAPQGRHAKRRAAKMQGSPPASAAAAPAAASPAPAPSGGDSAAPAQPASAPQDNTPRPVPPDQPPASDQEKTSP